MSGNNEPSQNGTSSQTFKSSTTVSQALEIARHSEEGARDPVVSNILKTALNQIWSKVQAKPDTYVMTRDEFAVFNYFQHQFVEQELAIAARRSSVGYSVLIHRRLQFGREKLLRLTAGFFLGSVVVTLIIITHGYLSLPCDLEAQAAELESVFRGSQVQARASANPPRPTSPGLLECFQVYQPVLTSSASDDNASEDGSSNTITIESGSCTKLLMEHSFGFSYGHPFVGNYIPPTCQFNRVVMNFTVTSRGRQFDRLALMYFGDTEVWRTSTAEPTQSGIKWTYMKDMSEYLYFWKEPQKIIFDLGNLIDSTYTGFFNTTLTATFFIGPDVVDPAPLIIPISARKSASNSASVFLLPADTASNTVTFPRNANRAVFSVSACGQAAEEFWWNNVLQSDVDSFLPADGALYGLSPWREVQVLVDGHLAGVHWPFPVIFTGGVVPGLWRPIVGIDAFDLREHEIDITPWLPVLSNGKQHTFEIKVAGIDDSGGTTGTVTETVGNFWYVTGKIFVWLDDPSSITTGTAPTLTLPQPGITLSQSYTQNATGVNQTLDYKTSVTRSLSISSIVKTQKGLSLVTWTQSLSYTNLGIYTNQGYTQWNSLTTTGIDTSTTGQSPYSRTYKYPLTANTTFWADPSGSGNFSLTATIDRGLSVEVTGKSIFPESYPSFSTTPSAGQFNGGKFSGSYLHTAQNGSAYYFASPSTNTGLSFGSTQQEFAFGGVDTRAGGTELYARSVQSVNSTIVYDRETLVGAVVSTYQGTTNGGAGDDRAFTVKSPKAAIGRGPGGSEASSVMGGDSR